MYHFLYYLSSAKKEGMKKKFLGDWEGRPPRPPSKYAHAMPSLLAGVGQLSQIPIG